MKKPPDVCEKCKDPFKPGDERIGLYVYVKSTKRDRKWKRDRNRATKRVEICDPCAREWGI